MSDTQRGIRAAQTGILINAALAGTKLVAGLVGNTYALVADAVESMADIFGSLIVWDGLHVASIPADDDHPFGHGKAEALAALVVSLMLLAAAGGIGIEAVKDPHAGQRARAVDVRRPGRRHGCEVDALAPCAGGWCGDREHGRPGRCTIPPERRNYLGRGLHRYQRRATRQPIPRRVGLGVGR